MTEIIRSIPFIVAGLIAVSLIASVGAIASRRLNFNYGWLTILSLMIYFMIGYYGGGIVQGRMVLIASLVVGTYDATVGWNLSKMFKANVEIPKDMEGKITYAYSLTVMAIVAGLFSGIGYAIKTN